MSTTTGPVQQLRSAESALLKQIDATTAVLDSIATDSIDAALARLQTAAADAATRLRMAATKLAATVLGLAGDCEIIAGLLADDLNPPLDPPQLPAPPVSDDSIDLAHDPDSDPSPRIAPAGPTTAPREASECVQTAANLPYTDKDGYTHQFLPNVAPVKIETIPCPVCAEPIRIDDDQHMRDHDAKGESRDDRRPIPDLTTSTPKPKAKGGKKRK